MIIIALITKRLLVLGTALVTLCDSHSKSALLLLSLFQKGERSWGKSVRDTRPLNVRPRLPVIPQSFQNHQVFPFQARESRSNFSTPACFCDSLKQGSSLPTSPLTPLIYSFPPSLSLPTSLSCSVLSLPLQSAERKKTHF